VLPAQSGKRGGAGPTEVKLPKAAPPTAEAELTCCQSHHRGQELLHRSRRAVPPFGRLCSPGRTLGWAWGTPLVTRFSLEGRANAPE
jgi:hypothetical protein